jgi:predicted ester cyclase
MFRKLSRIHPLFLTVLLALLLSTAACQPIQPVSAAKAATSERETNQAIVNRFYEEVVNQKHNDRFKDIMAEDFVAHEVSFVPPFKDSELFPAFPDFQLKVDKWVIEGDLVVALVTVTGTHQGELAGVAPTGNKVTFTQIDIWRVEDGRIAEVWHNFATADIMEQIGFQLVPPSE